MITEIPDNSNVKGWILFDADCAFCTDLAHRFAPLLHWHGFDLVPLQAPWARERLAHTGDALLAEMRLVTPEGPIYGGADALIALARQIWWTRPFHWFSRLPGMTPALRKAYGWVARHRHCFAGACRIPAGSRRLGLSPERWAPVVVLPTVAAILGHPLPGWVFMWLMALPLFLGAKWLTLTRSFDSKQKVSPPRLLAYLFLWPGMDAPAFCTRGPVPVPPVTEWALAGIKTLFGAVLLWTVAPLLKSTHPLITGWVGMLGLVFLLHFGTFHLLSLLWRTLGINARPIMQSLGTATSLSSFWGRNWNAAFSDLMQEQFLKSLARRLGARRAFFTIFLLSGAFHELVISLPAHGGYGLPTLYFMIQGLGLRLERSEMGQAIGLGSGWKGWCFVALVTGAPAFWLFHPPFVHKVILPMLQAIGAT